MNELPDFIRARLDEAEEIARAADGTELEPWLTVFEAALAKTDESAEVRRDVGRHIAHLTPARVLREVEAKRKLVELIRLAVGDGQPDTELSELVADDMLKLLALPYADHPSFKEEWRV